MEDLPSISIEQLVRRCCASGDIEAWEEFVRRFHRQIATVVLRTSSRLGDCSAQTVDDLIQETYLKLCRSNFQILREFEERHPNAFLGYLKVLAANVVRDHFKSSHAHKRGIQVSHELVDSVTPTSSLISANSPEGIERTVLLQQIQAHLDECVSGPEQERNRRIFWLYYRAGLTASAIANLPGIGLTTKGVESLILRVTRELRGRIGCPEGAPSEKVKVRGAGEGILSSESF